jgi:hypothetical protein
VTETNSAGGDGIETVGMGTVIAGNQVISLVPAKIASVTGIHALATATSPLIEANQVIGWPIGIKVDTDTNVLRNQISRCTIGIEAHTASTVTGNLASNDSEGADVGSQTMLTGNAFFGGGIGALIVNSNFTGVIEKNNFVGHTECGVVNKTGTTINVTNDYWGAAAGPGSAPADSVCNIGSTTNVTPVATKPFNVKAPIKP